MIKISIAGLTVLVHNKYKHIAELSAEYLCDGDPDFEIVVTEADISAEREMAERDYSTGYLESIAAYRKIAETIPKYSAVVFHGAVIAVNGSAYAVTARSGVGKTTHLLLWLKTFGDKVHILNGDKPILREIDGKIYACGTPWKGKENYGVSEMLPLKGIAFLKRGAENSAKRSDSNASLIPLISQIYLPENEISAKMALILANKIISTVPMLEFSVNMQDEAAKMAYDAFMKL